MKSIARKSFQILTLEKFIKTLSFKIYLLGKLHLQKMYRYAKQNLNFFFNY